MAQTKQRSSGGRSAGKSPARGKRSARGKKNQPELGKSWSILLFGVGLLLCAMAFVPGESAWLIEGALRPAEVRARLAGREVKNLYRVLG